MRLSLAPLAIGITGAVLALPVGAARPRPDPSGLTVRLLSGMPKRIPGSGYTLPIRVEVKRSSGAIRSVQAAAYVSPTGWGPVSPLAKTQGDVYEGSCRVPVNPSTIRSQATVVVLITGPDGKREQRTIGSFPVFPWTPSTMPPPPPSK